MKMNLPREWQVVELGDIFFFEKKSTLKASEGKEYGKYKFFTSSDKQTKFIDSPIFNGEYLIFSTGGKAGVHYCFKKFSASTDCLVVKVNTKILPKYVYYFLRKNIHLLDAGFQGAGLKHISKNYIKKIEILFPKNILIQQKIVTILDKAEKLKEMRKEADELTKDYLKAVFLEMFCSSTSKLWKEVSIEELALQKKGSMRTGPFGSDLKHSEFVAEGISVLGIDNVVKNYFDWKEKRFITKEKYRKLERYRVFPRDVLVTIMGTIGHSVVIPDDIPLSINTKHLACITLDEKKANPYFISYSLHSHPQILRQIELNNRGAIMAGLNLGIIKELKIKLPPIELQNLFEKIYHEVMQIKSSQEQSRSELDNLSNNLMQKAFRGELVC